MEGTHVVALFLELPEELHWIGFTVFKKINLILVVSGVKNHYSVVLMTEIMQMNKAVVVHDENTCYR
ncbi:hypothetical protein L1887_16083 [Cichorium endivia]|nr:hypothetical protein L1887_16083 [Cichorium endivia]